MNWYQHDLETKANELIDSHISEISGNLIFTVPVTVPYPPAMSEYTRIDGEINFEGHAYRMVKQKVQGNLLYIVCVKDDRTQVAVDEINEIIAAVSGQQSKESTSNGLKVANLLLKYCDLTVTSRNISATGWIRNVGFVSHDSIYRYDGADELFHPPSFI